MLGLRVRARARARYCHLLIYKISGPFTPKTDQDTEIPIIPVLLMMRNSTPSRNCMQLATGWNRSCAYRG